MKDNNSAPSTKDVRQNLGFSNHPCPGASEFSKTTPLRTSASGFSNYYFYTLFFPTIIFTHFLTPVEILAKYRGLIVLLPIHTDKINSNTIACNIFKL